MCVFVSPALSTALAYMFVCLDSGPRADGWLFMEGSLEDAMGSGKKGSVRSINTQDSRVVCGKMACRVSVGI